MTDHDPAELTAHALGLLDGAEARAVEEHLAGCVTCRRDWDELRETSTLLGDVPPEMFLDGPPDGDLVLQRALWRVRRERSAARGRRGLGIAVAAAVAGVVLAGGGVAVGRASTPAAVVAAPVPGPAAPGARTVEGGIGAVAMSATLTPAAGWVRVSATVVGIPRGERCTVVVVADDGTESVAGSWLVSAQGETGGTTVNGSAIVAPDAVAAVAIRDEAGREFISLPV